MKKTLFISILSLLTQVLIAQNKYRCATAEEQKKVFEGNSFRGIYGYLPDSVSFRQSCLTAETKQRIHDLLFVDYDFKDEMEEHKEVIRKGIENEAKIITKRDTTKYLFVLDSVYQNRLKENLEGLKSIKKDPKLIYLLGKIYYYEAIPMLKEIMKDSSKYNQSECFRLALARLGDKESYDYYINKYQKLSISNDEFYEKERIMTYLNTQESLWLFAEELKNKDLIIDYCSECKADMAYYYPMSEGFYLLVGYPKTSIHVPEEIKQWWMNRRDKIGGEKYSFKDAQKMYKELEKYVKGKFPLDDRNK